MAMSSPTGSPVTLTPDPLAGGPRQLGRYELIRPIAAGGMATVYLARAAGIGGFERLVAVKMCHPHLSGDATFAAMFLDEARLAARIHHPNVVATLDVGNDGGLYFVMEYVEGVTLAELLKARPEGLPPSIALRILLDVLAGLHAAHELIDGAGRPMNLVHRDISPQNILVGADGVSRIVDFGIAKAEARATVTRGHQIKGKFGYMPPEQFLGQEVTRKADVYAAGVVLWELLTGQRLFDADSDAAIMNLVLRGKWTPLATQVAVPDAVDAVVACALAREPGARFASARAFAQALESAGVELAEAKDVGTIIADSFADVLGEKRRLVEEATSAPAIVEARPAPTLLARVLDGSVMLVPRKVVLGLAGALLVAFVGLLWLLKAPGAVDTQPAATAPPTAPLAAPVGEPPEKPAAAAEPLPTATRPPAPLPVRGEGVSKPAKAARARPALRARPEKPHKPARRPSEFRPTEL